MRTTSAWVGVLLAVLVTTGTPRADETLGRGVIAVASDTGQAYVAWRLLKDDPPGVAFNVYRRTAGGTPVKVNAQPIVTSTNLVDTAAPMASENSWFVRPVVGGRELGPSETASLPASSPPSRVRSIRLQGDYLFNRVGICDLDGDGVFDYASSNPARATASTPARSGPAPTRSSSRPTTGGAVRSCGATTLAGT